MLSLTGITGFYFAAVKEYAMRKKLITIFTVLALVVSMSVAAHAATVSDIENRLKEIASERPGTASFVDDAIKWLKENPGMAAGKEAELLTLINEAYSEAEGKTYEQIIANPSAAAAVISKITAAGNLVGIEITVSLGGGSPSFNIRGMSSTNPIKQTGIAVNHSRMIIVSLALCTLFCAVLGLVVTQRFMEKRRG